MAGDRGRKRTAVRAGGTPDRQRLQGSARPDNRRGRRSVARASRLLAVPCSLAKATVKRGVLAVVILAGGSVSALAGHEVSFYPSYYPHEIRIDDLQPAAAATGLENNTLHAYIGTLPEGGARLPGHVKAVESLGSFLILRINPASPEFASSSSRCATARGILAALRTLGPSFAFHPYPVTPYHADYLHHLDRIEASKAALVSASPIAKSLKVQAKGWTAEAVARLGWALATDAWDLSLEEIPVSRLIADSRVQINGWLGPPWVKEGWFQAYRLLAPATDDAGNKRAADSIYRRLVHGEYLDLTERMDLERRLIATLTAGCERMVVGHTVRREFYNDDYSDGIENIGYDSQTGLNSPIFIRTVKLKDFPWNGELRLGVNQEPKAAWNPVGGFTDTAGRMIWSIVGDPALLPVPYSASWIPNRMEFDLERVQGQSGGFEVPADAVRPEPGTGALRPVAETTFGSVKLVYEVSASPFLDGTETEIADLLYAFVQAYRWGAKAGPDDRAYEPHLAPVLANLRDRLLGIRALRVERAINEIAPGVQVPQTTAVIEVYLKDAPGDPQQVAALAPPWSTVPWHLMALMEEAVIRGYAAFSRAEAGRRGVPWLDLVRDTSLHERLRALIGEFEEAGYRPATLQDLVSEDAARKRWRALRRFAEDNGHLLVTNGPYRLEAWKAGRVVFGAIRELTYPLGFGTFDRYVHPLRAVVREVTRQTEGIVVRVEVEKTAKVGRRTEVKLVPLNRNTARGIFGALVVSRYLLIGPDGAVVRADKMRWEGDDRFVVELPEGIQPGGYTVLVAVYLDRNSLTPSTGMLRFQVGG